MGRFTQFTHSHDPYKNSRSRKSYLLFLGVMDIYEAIFLTYFDHNFGDLGFVSLKKSKVKVIVS